MRQIIPNDHGIVIEVFTTLNEIQDSDVEEIRTYTPQPLQIETRDMKELYIDFDQELTSGHRLHNLVSLDGEYWYARLKAEI